MLQTELMEKWRPVLKQTEHIYTKTGDGELAYWAEEASKHRWIVEVGTLFGRSAKMMLLASPTAKLVCVDPFLQDGTYETACYFLRDELTANRCFVMRMNSPKAVQAQGGFLDGRLDMVMIDAGHEQEEVTVDIESWYPFLMPGGLICGHDLDPGNGVWKSVKHFFPNHTEPVPRVWAWTKPI